MPAGGVPSLSPAAPADCFLFCPLSPLPPFPTGRGRPKLFHARGFAPCIPGAEPGRQNAVLAGGLVSWLPDLLAVSVVFCPLSPQPPSPVGKGEILGYFMQGASPLASPGLNPRGTGEGGEPRARRGRARLVACLPCLCFTFLPPSPRPPSRREGGDFRLFYARGFAPCIPGWVGRGTGERGEPRARRGACPVGRPLTLPLVCFSAPIPHPPSRREGGDQSYFMQGASPLASPGLNLYGAGSTFGKQFLWVMPKTFPFNNIIEKSSGGSGGLFQESPSVF